MTSLHSKTFSIIIFIIFFIVFSLTIYVNYHMPHGPSYPTGEYACQNDDRGPCSEIYKEDMTNLNIPDWAKFLREYYFGVLALLCITGLYLKTKKEEGE